MNELKPCPFCGGEAKVYGDNNTAPEVWVLCDKCKASASAHTCRQPAVEAWNTRADDYKQAAEYWQRMYEQTHDATEKTCRIVNGKCTSCKAHIAERTYYTLHGTEGGTVSVWHVASYCPQCGAKVVE